MLLPIYYSWLIYPNIFWLYKNWTKFIHFLLYIIKIFKALLFKKENSHIIWRTYCDEWVILRALWNVSFIAKEINWSKNIPCLKKRIYMHVYECSCMNACIYVQVCVYFGVMCPIVFLLHHIHILFAELIYKFYLSQLSYKY